MDNIGQKTFIAIAWRFIGVWTTRLLGIISLSILARYLQPGDYGLVATAQLIVIFMQVVLADGAESYLIRKKTISTHDYNTAWTIRLVFTLLISLSLYCAKEFLSIYFNDPRLYNIFILLSLSVFISGFQNLGIIKCKKDLNIKPIVKFEIVQKIIGFTITVSLAVYLKSYWALLYGQLSLSISGVLLSYIFFNHRPKLRLIELKQQWNQMLFKNLI